MLTLGILLLIILCFRFAASEIFVGDGVIKTQQFPVPPSKDPQKRHVFSNPDGTSNFLQDLAYHVTGATEFVQSKAYKVVAKLDQEMTEAAENADQAKEAIDAVVSIWSWIHSVDWVILGKVIVFVAAALLFFILFGFICTYVVFPCLKCCEIIETLCCWCSSEHVNAVHTDEAEADECHIELDVYTHRNHILALV